MLKKSNALNYLRFLAMMTVIFQYSYNGSLNTQAGLSSAFFKLPAWGGVWIFFILSGYLIGCGFYKERYEISRKGLLAFYVKRFIKIAIPYYMYCFIWAMFCGEMWVVNNPEIVLKILTFTFNGIGGVSGIGHLWYVSTAMQLYLLSPLLFVCLKALRKETVVFWILLVGGGTLRLYIESKGYAWYTHIYTNVFTNLDLFVGGMLLNAWTTMVPENADELKIEDKVFRVTAFVIVHVLVLVNAFMLWLNTSLFSWMYKYLLPSIYLLVCACYILAFESHGEKYKTLQLTRKPMRLIDALSAYSYEIYLVHMAVLNTVELWFGEIRTKWLQVLYLIVILAVSYVSGMIFHMAGDGIVRKIRATGKGV